MIYSRLAKYKLCCYVVICLQQSNMDVIEVTAINNVLVLCYVEFYCDSNLIHLHTVSYMVENASFGYQ